MKWVKIVLLVKKVVLLVKKVAQKTPLGFEES